MQNQLREAAHTAGTLHCSHSIRGNSEVALAYAEAGISVFPCAANGPRRKQPLTVHGHHDATTDRDIVRHWWKKWPGALVGIPTGSGSGVWVLDIDGEAGQQSLNQLLARLGLDAISDLTRCAGRTPSSGLHLFFRLSSTERPRNRARDIGAGLDTRGVKADGSPAGYFIAPGSTLPDGQRYQHIDADTLEPVEHPSPCFDVAATAPRGLIYLATFSAAERAVIASFEALRDAIRQSAPCDWPTILATHQAAQREALRARLDHLPEDAAGIRAQALNDLHDAAASYANLSDGRREALFKHAARLARYVAHSVISDAELRTAMRDAATANGAAAMYGLRWVDGCITRALDKGRNDELPPLARRFRTRGEVRA